MRNLTVLVVGAGGREHALAWGLARSPMVGRVFVAPGNPGTEWPAVPGRAACSNLSISASDHAGLLAFARQERVALTVVGPEQPLADGIVDTFGSLPIFGPSSAASRLETSKAFAKQFMQHHGIPTAPYACFQDYDDACAYLADENRRAHGLWCGVIKADGLAAGKGVFVCDTIAEGYEALRQLMVERTLGAAGATVVIEQRLSGPEVSMLAICDGQHVLVLPPARDHKRLLDGDQGPNTGGMGAYAPAPDVDPELVATITRTIIEPAVAGMAARGTPYVGVLYAGVMLTENGPMALEYNCRFGDPEAQVLVPLIPDLYSVLQAAVAGQLDRATPRMLPGTCAAVVLAAPGYPYAPVAGIPITGLDHIPEQALVFHAGTADHAGQLVTAGGRVLAVGGHGACLEEALDQAYALAEQIHFDGMQYRQDIGRGVEVMTMDDGR